jgi:hypothetical protein
MIVETVGRRWRFPHRVIERARWLVDHFRQLESARSMPWPQLQRLLVSDASHELLSLHEAVAGADSPELAFCRARLALPPDQLNPAPLLTGDDLIAHGIAPGIVFRELLERVRDAQLERRITTRDEALELVDRLRDGESKHGTF